MSLGSPYYLGLFIVLAVIVSLYLKGRVSKEASLRFSSIHLVKSGGARSSSFRRVLSAVLKTICLALIIIALARPQTSAGDVEEKREVVDIMLALDISSSMATLDFHPENRLGAAKVEARNFIKSRKLDRLGLVVFAKHAFTQCPLTTDHQALLELLDKIGIGMIEDGTAIGVGIANALNRLRDSGAESRVIILLTDGVNNSGEIDPLTAAEIAKEFGIRVYTIGVGVAGEAIIPVDDPRFGQTFRRVVAEIDEKTLFEIARTTGGIYFRAKDEKALHEVFSEIDSLEKTEIKVERFTRYKDYYHGFILAGLAVFLLEILFSHFLFVKIP